VKDDAGKEVSLSDYKGKVLKRYEPTDKMSDIEADVQNELQQN
jgi:glutathione peroxidase-family protein